MNGVAGMLAVIQDIVNGLAERNSGADCLICPPATLLFQAAERAKGTALSVGGQDCHVEASGAHTGDVAAEMIADAGGEYVIVGHSERRADHHESSETVAAKAAAAHRASLIPIICVGETLGQREAGQTLSVIEEQIARSIPDSIGYGTFVVAYEPVWAIGTGLTPTVADVTEAHAFIRSEMKNRFAGEGASMRLLYGGSVKPDNAAELLGIAHVDGALIGGASLKAADFLAICKACGSLLD